MLVLSRQHLPTLDRRQFAPAEQLRRGAYVLNRDVLDPGARLDRDRIRGLGSSPARHANRVLTYRTILMANPAVHTTSHLWERIGRLRRKIEADPFRPRYLVSEPWVGYRFVDGAQ